MSIKSKKRFSTLFLDRDGVINHKTRGYIQSYVDFNFIDGVKRSICRLNNLFDRIIIVTNQQGIGKNLMTVKELNILHDNMISEIESCGGRIDKIYYCPHLLIDNCHCRKPRSGMLIQAQRDFSEIDFKRSILIGDSETDIQAAESEGIKGVQVSDLYTLSDWTDEFIDD